MSTGKLLSNMHRSGPNRSIQYCIKGDNAAASSSEPMGVARACQSKPKRCCPTPPSFMRTLGQAATAAMPRREACGQHLVVPVGVRADPHQAPDMVHDDGELGHRPGKRGQLCQLGVVQRRLQAQSHARQHPGACLVLVADSTPSMSRFTSSGLGFPPDRMTDAAKPLWVRPLGDRFEHRGHPLAPFQIGIANNGGGPYLGTTICPTGASSVASASTNLTSPTGRISSGPSVRYRALTSINTVERTWCPL